MHCVEKRKKNKKKKNWIRPILFLGGLSLCSFPILGNMVTDYENRHMIQSYEKAVTCIDFETSKEDLKRAKNYNQILYQVSHRIVDQAEGKLTEEVYRSCLNPLGNGVMGSVEIPVIHVNLPIYHGTEEEVLSVGVGHVYESSLPVGGESSHSILTGHSGLPGAKLFTRLDEMRMGDLFYVNIYTQKLKYQVVDIQVIEPTDTKNLKVYDGRDLVSLITCTPYGINTHRLVVTGERVETEKEETQETNVRKESFSLREGVFILIPCVFIVIAFRKGWKIGKTKRKR